MDATRSELRIALLQMTACGADIDANADKGEAFCRRAAAAGADIALFPEMWSHGYEVPAADARADEVAAWAATALAPDHPYVTRIQRLAAELDMAVAVTYLERSGERPRNAMTLFDRRGERVLHYAKVHTCAFDRERHLQPGDDFPVVALDTAAGEAQVGAMICYDREFPESARLLMLGGAELMLVPNCCDMEANRLAQLRTRAMENMAAVALANHAGCCNGHSVAYDGIAFGADEQGRDMLLVEAGDREGVYLATLDLAALRDYRARETWGDAFRRPSCYAELLRPAARPPFVRPEAPR